MILRYYDQTIIISTATVLCLTLLYTNKKGWLGSGRFFYLLSAVIFILVIYFYLYHLRGIHVESENIFLPVMAFAMLIFDGKIKHIIFWFLVSLFLYLKHIGLTASGVSHHDAAYVLNLIGNLVVALLFYIITWAFRNTLMKSLDENDQYLERLNLMVSSSPIKMALINTNGDYLLANQDYVSDVKETCESIVGKNRSEVIPSSIAPAMGQFFQRATQGEVVSFFEKLEISKERTITVEGRFIPILDKKGRVESVYVCNHDVTDLIRVQEDLKQANATKDKLFSIIAHDIKNPLSTFESMLTLSEAGALSDKEFMRHQQVLKERVKSINSTISELLEWSRMQLGGINTNARNVNVGSCVAENIDLFNALITKKRLNVTYDNCIGSEVWIDPNHLKIALRNIIHNAIKFTTDGGFIRLNFKNNQNGKLIQISDSGVGMDQKTIAAILNKKIQISKPGTDKEQGSGLGLSLSLGLLDINNCSVEIKSELGKGTTFEIMIPNGVS